MGGEDIKANQILLIAKALLSEPRHLTWHVPYSQHFYHAMLLPYFNADKTFYRVTFATKPCFSSNFIHNLSIPWLRKSRCTNVHVLCVTVTKPAGSFNIAATAKQNRLNHGHPGLRVILYVSHSVSSRRTYSSLQMQLGLCHYVKLIFNRPTVKPHSPIQLWCRLVFWRTCGQAWHSLATLYIRWPIKMRLWEQAQTTPCLTVYFTRVLLQL